MKAYISVGYKFDAAEERSMMQKAMAEIDSCDILVAETSEKAIGIGIEAGYAKAKNKTIIYLRNANAEHSTTLSGISDFHVAYNDAGDLESKLRKVLCNFKENN